MAKVLHDFKDGDTAELAVREKLEREFDEFIRKESQGEFLKRAKQLATNAHADTCRIVGRRKRAAAGVGSRILFQ
jgi:hypothetical protein